jgi:hypothetical protein
MNAEKKIVKIFWKTNKGKIGQLFFRYAKKKKKLWRKRKTKMSAICSKKGFKFMKKKSVHKNIFKGQIEISVLVSRWNKNIKTSWMPLPFTFSITSLFPTSSHVLNFLFFSLLYIFSSSCEHMTWKLLGKFDIYYEGVKMTLT